jgi:glycosyltransferase involved in cell wall biosynthesis
MFGWEFPPCNSGGLGVACYGLTRALARLGLKITFVLPKNLGAASDIINIKHADAVDYSKDAQINKKELAVFLYPYLNEKEYKDKIDWLHLLNNLDHIPFASDLISEVMRYAALSRKIAKEENFDIIHAHDWLAFPAGQAAQNISGKKLILHAHSTEFDRTANGALNETVYEIEKQGFRQADQVVAVSNHTKAIINQKYGIKNDKISVVHNGIDEDFISPAKEAVNALYNLKKNGNKLVLSLGRITIQKGLDHLLRAAKHVIDLDRRVFFLFAGSGEMERQLMHQAAELGISDNILFCGWLRGEDITRAYRAADLFIMPSVSEPFGLTALESMAYNTPVIVSKQSGVSEAIEHALKVDFWDDEEIANKIISVLAYKELGLNLCKNAKEEIKKINWAEAAKKCLNLYNNLLINPA